MRSVFDRFEERVLPRWPGLRAQVMHGDLTLDNALLDDDGRITGIVDFGDMSHTALLADPVSALDSVLSIRQGDELFRAAAALLDGYTSVTPLEPDERALLGDTLAARIALTVTISAWRVERFPENARYIQSWDRNAWSMLEQFAELGFDETARRFGAPPEPPADRRPRRPPRRRSSAQRSRRSRTRLRCTWSVGAASGSRTSTAVATSTRTTTCRSSGTRTLASRTRSPTRRAT